MHTHEPSGCFLHYKNLGSRGRLRDVLILMGTAAFVLLSIGFVIPSKMMAPLPVKEKIKSVEAPLPNTSVQIVGVTIPNPKPEFNVRTGYRAVALEVDARSGLEGLILPNSVVDVALTYVDGSGRLKTEVIAQAARVLATEGGLFFAKGKQSLGALRGAAVLEVLPQEAVHILHASQLALTTLLLRSPKEAGPSGTSMVSSNEIIGGCDSTESPPSAACQTQYCPSRNGASVKVGTPLFAQGFKRPKVLTPISHQCRRVRTL